MCSACIDQLAAGVEERGRAVVALLDVGRVGGADQRRAHLLAGRAQPADHHLQGDGIEAHGRLDVPVATHRAAVACSASIVPASSTRRASRAARRRSPRAARRRAGPRPRSRRRARRAGPASRPTRRRSAPGARPPRAVARRPPREPRLRPGGDQRQADVDEHDLALGIAVAVALLVRLLEALGQVGWVGTGRSRHRQLEGLAARSASRRSTSGSASREASPSSRAASSSTSAAIRSASKSAPRSITVRAVSRRRSEAQRPSAESTPPGPRAEDALDAELGGDRGGVHRPGAAERQQREAARVDAALDRDDAQRPHHLLVGDPHDPLGGLQLAEAERPRRGRPIAACGRVARRARRRRPGSSRGARQPSSRLASVTVGSAPPRP